MTVQRGEVLLALFPFATGLTAKKRPVLVVHADSYNRSAHNAIVVEITSNSVRASDPAHLFVDISSTDGQATGLLRNCVVSCLNLATVNESRFDRVIGSFSPVLMEQVDECLKVALELA